MPVLYTQVQKNEQTNKQKKKQHKQASKKADCVKQWH